MTHDYNTRSSSRQPTGSSGLPEANPVEGEADLRGGDIPNSSTSRSVEQVITERIEKRFQDMEANFAKTIDATLSNLVNILNQNQGRTGTPETAFPRIHQTSPTERTQNSSEQEHFIPIASTNRPTSIRGMDNVNYQRNILDSTPVVDRARTVPIHPITPRSFNGDFKKARSWIKEYNETCTINGYTDEEKKLRMVAYLTGEAKNWYYGAVREFPNISWQGLVKVFLDDFSLWDPSEDLLLRLANSKQRRDEQPYTFYLRVLGYCLDYQAEMPETELVRRIMGGLLKEISNPLLAGSEPEERTLRWLKGKLKELSVEGRPEFRKDIQSFDRRVTEGPIATPQGQIKRPSNDFRRTYKSPQKVRDHSSLVCFNCGINGHALPTCSAPRNDSAIAANRQKFRDLRKGRSVKLTTLNTCIEDTNVDVRELPNNANVDSQPSNSPRRDIAVIISKIEHLPCDDIKKPNIELTMNGARINGRLDSGADLTIIPASVAEQVCAKIIPMDDLQFSTATDQALVPIGMASVTIEHEDKVKPLLVAVVRDRDQKKPLWGLDLMNLFNLCIEFGDGDFRLLKKRTVRLDEKGIPIEPLVSISSLNTAEKQNSLKGKLNYGDLGVDERSCLEKELLKFSDVFSTSETDIGHTKTVQHKIPLSDNVPVFSKPYRVPFRHRDMLKELLDKMIKARVIRPSTSPYASPILFVDKPDGGKRLCVDYRKLNAKSILDRTPMPHPEDVFAMMAGTTIFAKLDITSMFWQIEIAPEDIEKTAFTTNYGLFEFLMMPFGLTNAPATAVRLMREVLRGLDGVICYVYFDDILIFAKNLEELINRITLVLSRIREHGIKLKPTKCGFGLNSTTYLGHRISADGISVDESRIQAIREFPIPKDQHDVRSFHGLCSYNRKYVKGFASIARPLTNLMKKDCEFTWNQECQDAFEKLKEALINHPILVHYDPDSEHELRTDACAYGMGAVLFQKSNEAKKQGAILYLSKSLNKAQRNYSTTERECLAAFWAMTSLKHYLLGRKFVLVTDHAPLSLLKNGKDPHQRLARWVAQLQCFDFEVRYKPGNSHTDADCLSRMVENDPESNDDSDEIEEVSDLIRHINSVVSENGCIDIAKEQQNDPFCQKILEGIKSKENSRSSKYFEVQDNLLHHKDRLGNLMLVIPKSQVEEILCQSHDIPLAGHMGFKRTYDLIKERFFWRNMRSDIVKYIKTCDKCQKRKVSNTRPQGFTEPLPIAEEVFDTVGIDLIDKLPISKKGNSHILVMTDNLSKYVIAVPLSDSLAETINNAIYEELITKFGCPKIIISDRGSNLTAVENNNFFNSLGIRRILTTAYHPQSNGQTERYNRVIKAQLTMFVEKAQKNWCTFVSALVFAYNVSKHSVTHVTPYEMVFARKPRIPMDNIFGRQQYINPNCPGLEARAEEAKDIIKDYIRKSQARNKKRMDQFLDPNRFQVGDLVVVRRPTIVKGGARKLTYTYIGPFRIVKKLNNLNFEVVNMSGKPRSFPVHPIHLRKYYPRGVDSDVIPPRILMNPEPQCERSSPKEFLEVEDLADYPAQEIEDRFTQEEGSDELIGDSLASFDEPIDVQVGRTQ